MRDRIINGKKFENSLSRAEQFYRFFLLYINIINILQTFLYPLFNTYYIY